MQHNYKLQANLSEQLEHERNLQKQQDRYIQQLHTVVQNLQNRVLTPLISDLAN